MRVLHLFAGGGGSHLAGELLGWTSAGSVELNPHARAIIRHHYPNERMHDDITTFNARPLQGQIEGIAAGFPCQGISCAGRGRGLQDPRSALFWELWRCVLEAQPSWVFIENSPVLQTKGLQIILEKAAEIGYDAEWATLRAADVGASHLRRRMFVLLHSNSHHQGSHSGSRTREGDGEQTWNDTGRLGADLPDTDMSRRTQQWRRSTAPSKSDPLECGDWWETEPRMGRVVDGMAARVDRIERLGNGWCPQQAAAAFMLLRSRIAQCI